MRLRYIEIFHAVMQAGSVKGAADILHITQPAASRLLQQAEQRVGVMLFERVRGRLVPTREAAGWVMCRMSAAPLTEPACITAWKISM